jgi:hypothetical protein
MMKKDSIKEYTGQSSQLRVGSLDSSSAEYYSDLNEERLDDEKNAS